jgi:hypothetical protein
MVDLTLVEVCTSAADVSVSVGFLLLLLLIMASLLCVVDDFDIEFMAAPIWSNMRRCFKLSRGGWNGDRE